MVQITETNVIPRLKECTFRIACDVTNPLCGEQGGSAIYGPQKGADTYFHILRGVMSLQEAMDHDNAARNMVATVEQVFRLVKRLHKA